MNNLRDLAKALGWADIEELAKQLEKRRLWERPQQPNEEEIEHEGSD